MPIPAPQPGLVIRYSYLWRDEARRGQEEGAKDRPCAVILTVQGEDDHTDVAVLPIMHTPPRASDDAIEIPSATKRRLGLDDAPSWIVTTEANIFAWPGPDVRPARSDGEYAYGYLPAGLTRAIIAAFQKHRKAVRRTE